MGRGCNGKKVRLRESEGLVERGGVQKGMFCWERVCKRGLKSRVVMGRKGA